MKLKETLVGRQSSNAWTLPTKRAVWQKRMGKKKLYQRRQELN